MIDFIKSCMDLVLFPFYTENSLILVPFFLLVISFLIRMTYKLMHISTR